MKSVAQHLLSLAIFLAIAFTASAVFAQEETETSENEQTTEQIGDTVRANMEERQQNREDMRKQLEERKAEVQENIATRRAALATQIQERITNLAANLSNRLDAATARLQNITDRLESRIEKLKDRGVNTANAETELANAQAAIDAAKNALSNIDAVVQTAISSEDPRTAWQEVKTTYLTIREHVKDAHESLRVTVALLKTAILSATDDTGVSDAVQNENSENTDSTEE